MSDFIAIDKPIAVHLHLYYTDMWSELRDQLQNINATPYDLFVTLVKEDAVLIDRIRRFKPDAHILIIKNMGYDIGPFIEFLNHINLDNYDYVLKLHSKCGTSGSNDTRLNGKPITRYWWKILLSQALIGTAEIWNKNINALKTDNSLGMIASPYLIKKADKCDAPLLPEIQKQLQKLGLPSLDCYSFVAGTMFMVRSSLLKVLQHQYTIEDFQKTDSRIKDGTLAHVMERLFGAIVIAQNSTIRGFAGNFRFACFAAYRNFLRFLYQKKTTQSHKILIKICSIPIYRKNEV